jgi:parvulin-like peptidyl-prolyl isomerase
MKSMMSTKFLVLIPLAALCFAQQPVKPGTPAPKPPPPTLEPVQKTEVAPDTVVLTVGAEKVTRAQFENLMAALPDQARAQGKRKIAEQLAELKAMAQEARKRKLDQSPETQQLIALQTENALASVLFKEISATVKPDDASARTYYDSHKGQFEQVKASHILIRYKGSPVPLRADQKELTPEEALAKAQEVRKKLADGGDFAAIAKAESDDVGTAQVGGSLGTFSKGQMVPEFEQAAFSLPVGQLSEPIKTKFGYHIIRVDSKAEKTFDEVKDSLEKQMKPQMAQQAAQEIRKQAQVTLDDAYFGSK